MKDRIIHFPNKSQKYLVPIMAVLAVAPGIAFSTLPFFASATPGKTNWTLLFALILIAYVGLHASYRLYSESRIAVILDSEGVRIVGAKKRFHAFWAWNDITHRTIEDAFKRQYVVLTTDAKAGKDDDYIMRNSAEVLISENIAAFRIDNAPEKEAILDTIINR